MNITHLFEMLENQDLSINNKLNKAKELAIKLNTIFIYADSMDIIHVIGKYNFTIELDSGVDFSLEEDNSILKELLLSAFYYGEIDYEKINSTKIPWTFNSPIEDLISHRFSYVEVNQLNKSEIISQGIIIDPDILNNIKG